MAKKRLMKLEDLLAFKLIGRIAISPDGTRVAFELKRADAAENKNFTQLMLADTRSGEVRPLTEAGEHNDLRPKWSRNGKFIAFLSTREKKTSALYVLPLDGGEPHRITDLDGDVHDFDISPDGRRIVYTYQPITERQKLERDGKSEDVQKQATYKHITRLTHKLDGAGFWNGHRTHVWIVSVAGGKPKQLSRGDYDDSEPRFSPDGRRVSYVSNRTDDPDRMFDQADVYVVPATGGPARRVTQAPGSCEGHSWSPDGKTIAFVGSVHKPGDWWKHDAHVHLVPSAGGKPRELARDVDADHLNVTIGDLAGSMFEALPPIFSRDGRTVYFLASRRGATELCARSLSARRTRVAVGGKVNVYAAQRAANADVFALAIGTATNPGDIYIFDAAQDAPPRRLTNVNKWLERVELVEPEEFELSSGGVKLQCWVLKPPGFRANRKYPAIVEIHGGPQAQYGYSMFHEMQWLAARGYVVAYTNPRGSAGYGNAFRKCIVGDWGNLDYKDVRKLGDWVFSRRWVDKTRVGVTGGSYGGFMTNWIIGHESRYRAAVTQRSVVNMETMFGSSDFGHVIVSEIGGPPWKGRDKMLRQSPIKYVEKMRTPLLIIHSEQDLRCPINEAEQLFVSLKYLGREVEYVAFEGESHGLSRGGRPQNRLERLRRICGWFDRYMK
ncbi:MAG: S9 family peptidase [Planctomycetota bacterium]|nr:MAG: S9 family peptidase [Planctomycetota bacterium]